MSSNNYIKIRQSKGKWYIEECDADTGKAYLKIDSCNSLEDAIDIANEYEKENEIEYGLRIKK